MTASKQSQDGPGILTFILFSDHAFFLVASYIFSMHATCPAPLIILRGKTLLISGEGCTLYNSRL